MSPSAAFWAAFEEEMRGACVDYWTDHLRFMRGRYGDASDELKAEAVFLADRTMQEFRSTHLPEETDG